MEIKLEGVFMDEKYLVDLSHLINIYSKER